MTFWTHWQGFWQEEAIRREAAYYQKKVEKLGIPPEMDQTTLHLHLRDRLVSRDIQPKPKGDLHIFFAAPLGSWEKHNIPPALRKFGEVTPFYTNELGFDEKSSDWIHERHLLDQKLLETFEAAHARKAIDVFVSYLSGTLVSPGTIRRINQSGIFSCAWWFDDRLKFRGKFLGGRYGGAASLASSYDLNLTSASDSIVKYIAEGGLALFWPPAGNPELCTPREKSFEFDVSFIGSCYGRRLDMIRYLTRGGISVETFGEGWPNGPVTAEEMVEIYARSRINLGFSGIAYSAKEMCLKERDFSIPMSGGLLLCGDFPDLRRVYEVGREVLTYTSQEDCLKKIRHLLNRPQKCSQIRRAARGRALRDHTWEKRFQKVFELAGVLPC